MLYCSCNMACNWCNCYFSFWANFCPFAFLTSQKIKIKQKWKKKHLEISSFYNSVPKIMIICYTIPEIWCVTNVIIFHFGPFFGHPHNKPKNQNLKKKMKEMPGDIIIFHMCTKNYDQMMYISSDMVCKGQTDGWKKWHIEVGAPPKYTVFE